MRGNPHVRFGPGAVGKGPDYRAPRRRPTGAPVSRLFGTRRSRAARQPCTGRLDFEVAAEPVRIHRAYQDLRTPVGAYCQRGRKRAA
jgi:hypothetical protein